MQVGLLGGGASNPNKKSLLYYWVLLQFKMMCSALFLFLCVRVSFGNIVNGLTHHTMFDKCFRMLYVRCDGVSSFFFICIYFRPKIEYKIRNREMHGICWHKIELELMYGLVESSHVARTQQPINVSFNICLSTDFYHNSHFDRAWCGRRVWCVWFGKPFETEVDAELKFEFEKTVCGMTHH